MIDEKIEDRLLRDNSTVIPKSFSAILENLSRAISAHALASNSRNGNTRSRNSSTLTGGMVILLSFRLERAKKMLEYCKLGVAVDLRLPEFLQH
jgi:hypothetical protein